MEMVIILIMAAVIGYAVYSTVKHFKGEGGCCGRKTYKTKKKKLKNVIKIKVFIVEDMHCEHCKNRVEEVINDIHGLAGRVD